MFARAAFADVTPRNRPVALAGYAARQAPVSTILDPIEISAVLLESAEHRCLMLSFDLMIVGAELRHKVLSRLEKHSFRHDEVALLASHTHSAPATDEACRQLGPPDTAFVDDAADAVEALVSRMLQERPWEMRMEIFRGRLDHSINRRLSWPYPTFSRTYGFRSKRTTLSPNPSGPTNELATIVVLRKAEDAQPFALLWHYTCHATAMTETDLISADFPGVVRQALRQRVGYVPCIYLQGFCGDIRPRIAMSGRLAWRERLRRAIRVISSGPLFPTPSFADWQSWSMSLADRLCEILSRGPAKTLAPIDIKTSCTSIPLNCFFAGAVPDKEFEVHLIQIGAELEIVALSAEATVEWQHIIDTAAPPLPHCIRLYAGYSGALFGYLPTTAQVMEGGYEVEGFQSLFGLSGHFNAGQLEPVVTSVVKAAFDDLERSGSDAIDRQRASGR